MKGSLLAGQDYWSGNLVSRVYLTSVTRYSHIPVCGHAFEVIAPTVALLLQVPRPIAPSGQLVMVVLARLQCQACKVGSFGLI